MIDNKSVAKERLIKLRTYLGLSSKDFAAQAGIDPSNYSSIETGKRSFGNRVMRDICNTFGVNIDWLLTGEGEMLKESTPKEEKSPQGGVTIPDDVWNVIKNQAESLKDQAASLESKDKQLEGVIDMLRIKEAQTSEMLDLLRAIHKKSQFAGGRPSAANSTVVEVEE